MIFLRNAKGPEARILESIDYMIHRPDFEVNFKCDSNENLLFYCALYDAPPQATVWLLELGCDVHVRSNVG